MRIIKISNFVEFLYCNSGILFCITCFYIFLRILYFVFFAFSTLRCLKKLQCEERILDLRFQFEGEMLAVIQEWSGISLYRTTDCTPVAQYVLQKRFVLTNLIM